MYQGISRLVISSGLLFAVAVASEAEVGGFEVKAYNFSLSSVNLSKDSYWEDFERYADGNPLEKTWLTSRIEVRDPTTSEFRKQYLGEWDVEEPYNLKALQGDQALILKKSNVAAMIGSRLPTPISLEADSSFVVQYEVQLHNELRCGGAFLKLLPLIEEDDLIKYAGNSPALELLFGPDMCPPYTDEIHLGIKKTNPISMRPELKMLKQAPLSQLNDVSVAHLYTLVLKGSTNEFEIRVDGSVVKAGNLLEEGAFVPGFNPPRYVPDPEETKPVDWDDRQHIPDPEAVKPEHWNESEPPQIIDENDLKPEDWDESMPVLIADPNREEPEWWDDDKYGMWIAPMIENPECENISGCGEWMPHMLENPNYKGPWEPPMVPNPNYQGVWEPKSVANPDYYEDSAPAKLENPIGGIVFEFWSGTTDLIFDNIYIGKHIEEAERLGNATFLPKKKFQEEQLQSKLVNEARKPKEPPVENTEIMNFYDSAIEIASDYLTKISEKTGLEPTLFVTTTIILLLGVFGLKRLS